MPARHIDDGFEALLQPFYNGKKLTDPIDTRKDKFQLLPAFLKVKGLVKQHIDSYDWFVDKGIKDIVRANSRIRSDVESRFQLKFTDIRVQMPQRCDSVDIPAKRDITPSECRLRDMTYAAPIVVDISYIRDKVEVTRRDVPLGRMPVMLRSSKCRLRGATNLQMQAMDECPLDPGGYFIINGTEKVILIQEQLSKNRVLVEKDDKNHAIQASVHSSTHERKTKAYVKLKKGRLWVTHNSLSEDIPIIIFLKALGGLDEVELRQLIAGDKISDQEEFGVNVEEAARAGVHDRNEALEYIGSRVRMGAGSRRPLGGVFMPGRRNHVDEAMDALSDVIIGHVPMDQGPTKAIYVALMARRVLLAARDPKQIDDRDFVGNKRFELAGQMLSLLFEDLFKRFTNELKLGIDKFLKKNNQAVPLDPASIIQIHSRSIGHGLDRAIQTGNWTVKRFGMHKVGVTHVLSRLSYISALGMMTRISSQFEKSRKVSGPRALHTSQWGMLCPSDTPEGEACGLVKNLALMTHITTNVDEKSVVDRLFDRFAVEDLTCPLPRGIHHNRYFVYVNGTPVGLIQDAEKLAWSIRHARRRGDVGPFISVHLNPRYRALHVATDEGRICRPYIIVTEGKPKLNATHLRMLQLGVIGFDSLLRGGVVEYLDVNEQNDTLIAVEEDDIIAETTHMEIEPFTILGAVAGLIPFPHHNQSPRNTYQCAMGKQAIGAIAYNQFNRIDTLLYTMVYPQRPLVTTRTIELIHYDKLPAGQNATVVVMSYSGYDIEDALVLNKASCERGFGRCQVFRKHATELQKYPNGRKEVLGKPPQGDDLNAANKEKWAVLDDDGLPMVGMQIKQGQTLIMKQTPLDSTTTGIGLDRGPSDYRDTSITYRTADPSYIDKVMYSHTEKGTTVVKVQTRQTRQPEIGDKFSSRHGQKGVVGLIVDQEDLPFSDTGVVPDIIMNPHGFPSRMTVGKLLECLTGKAAVLAGKPEYGYGDAFRSHPVEEMGKALVDHGFCWEGKDYMTSGITGEPLEAYIFNGPIYYQRLKHMVQDKMHARARGPRAILTRQPTEGRARDGGLRLGEMERDCLIAYGASQLLIERLMTSSDAIDIDVCQHCGLFGYKGYCNTCDSTQQVTKVTMPYAAKLLFQELNSMNIGVRLKLEDEFPHPSE